MPTSSETPRAFYFGCGPSNAKGHYFKGLHGEKEPDIAELVPWGYGVDRSQPSEIQGLCAVDYRDGWTLLSFADRTVDHRGGSHSSFVFEAELTAADALALAREQFPWVFDRIRFEIRLREEASGGE